MARTERTYLDFDLEVGLGEGGQLRAQVVDSPAGQAEESFAVPLDALELENFVLRVGRTRTGRRRVGSPQYRLAQEVGEKLYDALFTGEVRIAFRRSLDRARDEGKGLRVRLRLDEAPELAQVPWEYLYASGVGDFLVLSSLTPLVRHLDLPLRDEPLAIEPPLRVLVAVSSPNDLEPLDTSREVELVRRAVDDLEARGTVEVHTLEHATLRDLRRTLRRDTFHVLHFVGHGGFDETHGDGVLALEDDHGRSRHVSGQQLGTILHDHRSLRLVVLNACEGARTSATDPFSGVAQSLLRRGVPAAVAMQFEITDEAAIAFSHELYLALVEGLPVEAAVAEARLEIFSSDNDIEWGTPVLYSRAKDGRLFDVADRVPADAPPVRSRADLPPPPPPTPSVAAERAVADADRASAAAEAPTIELVEEPTLTGAASGAATAHASPGGGDDDVPPGTPDDGARAPAARATPTAPGTSAPAARATPLVPGTPGTGAPGTAPSSGAVAPGRPAGTGAPGTGMGMGPGRTPGSSSTGDARPAASGSTGPDRAGARQAGAGDGAASAGTPAGGTAPGHAGGSVAPGAPAAPAAPAATPSPDGQPATGTPPGGPVPVGTPAGPGPSGPGDGHGVGTPDGGPPAASDDRDKAVNARGIAVGAGGVLLLVIGLLLFLPAEDELPPDERDDVAVTATDDLTDDETGDIGDATDVEATVPDQLSGRDVDTSFAAPRLVAAHDLDATGAELDPDAPIYIVDRVVFGDPTTVLGAEVRLGWDDDLLVIFAVVTDGSIASPFADAPSRLFNGDAFHLEIGPDPFELGPDDALRAGDLHVMAGPVVLADVSEQAASVDDRFTFERDELVFDQEVVLEQRRIDRTAVIVDPEVLQRLTLAADDLLDAVVGVNPVRGGSFVADASAGGDITARARAIEGGYAMELAIPWETLGVEPATGLVLGMNLNVSDVRNGSLATMVSSNAARDAVGQARPGRWQAVTLVDVP